jgi:hypothetical protein
MLRRVSSCSVYFFFFLEVIPDLFTTLSSHLLHR